MFLRKISKIIIAFIVFGIQVVQAQTLEQALQEADASFKKRDYAKCLQLYQQVLEEEAFYTEKMLLQMAYICEGQEDYTKALYYLNLYYLNKPIPKVLDKITELAQKYKLNGYQTDDSEYLHALYKQHQEEFLVIWLVFFSSWFSILVIRRWQGKEVTYPALAMAVGLGLFFIVYNYYSIEWKKGIVSADKAFLMSAPSAGAELLSTPQKGDCLRIVGTEDIWYKVKWKDQEAYIRNHNLYLVY